jgi:phage shock protein A
MGLDEFLRSNTMANGTNPNLFGYVSPDLTDAFDSATETALSAISEEEKQANPFLNFLGGLFNREVTSDVLGGAADYFQVREAKGAIDEAIARGDARATGLVSSVEDKAQFQPFTVTSSLATPTFTRGSGADASMYNASNTYQAGDVVDAGGTLYRARRGVLGDTAGLGNTNFWEPIPRTEAGFDIGLSPQQQLIESGFLDQVTTAQTLPSDISTLPSTLRTGATNLFNEATTGRATREQEIFDRLTALRQPEQERARLALQNRLFNEGRQGLRTSQYGGTPEQLAFEKAIQEQQAQDSLLAMTQAGDERQDAFSLGSGLLAQSYVPAAQQLQQATNLLQAGYTPQREAFNQLELGANIARLPLSLQRDIIEATANVGRAGMETATALEQDKGQLDIASFQALADLLGGRQDEQGQYAGGLLSAVLGGSDVEGSYLANVLSSITDDDKGFFDTLTGGIFGLPF